MNPVLKLNFFAAYLFTSDKANLLDIKESCKVGRFDCNLLDINAVIGYCCGMTYEPTDINDHLKTLPKPPPWVTSGRAETFEAVALRSGAILDGA